MTLQNDMPANDNEKIIEELGGEWNSSYGHWEFRLSAKRPILTINPDEALELSSRITDYATRQNQELQTKLNAQELHTKEIITLARTEELKHWQWKTDGHIEMTGEEVEERIAELEATLIDKGGE